LQGPPTPGRIAAAVAAAAGTDITSHVSSAPLHEADAERCDGSAAANSSIADPTAGISSSTSSSADDLQGRNTSSSEAWEEERAALLAQHQLRSSHMEKLVAFAGHCRLMLQDLQPGAVAAAAAGQQQQGRRSAGALAGKEPMARLVSLTQELDASRWASLHGCGADQTLEQLVLRRAVARTVTAAGLASRA
jgi:hypothetical protein